MTDQDVEYAIKTLPIDANLQAEAEKLAAEGWQMVTQPIATYFLVRPKPVAAPLGMQIKSHMLLDDSKIAIIKANS